MIKLYDRYLTLSALRGIAFVALALTLLLSLGAIVDELKDVGEGRYTMAKALQFVGLTMPRRLTEILAVSALVGGVLGLGNLANNRELDMLRLFGISPLRIVGALVPAALIILCVSALFLEYVAPRFEQEASRMKRVALANEGAALSDEDLWVQEEGFIARIGLLRDSGELGNVDVYRENDQREIVEFIRAQSGLINSDGSWTLFDLRRDDLQTQTTERLEELRFSADLTPKIQEILASALPELPPRKLWRRLQKSDDTTEALELARWFWKRVGSALFAAAMVLLAVPFALGRTFNRSVGKRLVLGVVLGAFAHILVQVANWLAKIYEVDPFLAGLAPAAIVIFSSVIMVARIP